VSPLGKLGGAGVRHRVGHRLPTEPGRHALRPALAVVHFGQFGEGRPTLQRVPRLAGIIALVSFNEPTGCNNGGYLWFVHRRHVCDFSLGLKDWDILPPQRSLLKTTVA